MAFCTSIENYQTVELLSEEDMASSQFFFTGVTLATVKTF